MTVQVHPSSGDGTISPGQQNCVKIDRASGIPSQTRELHKGPPNGLSSRVLIRVITLSKWKRARHGRNGGQPFASKIYLVVMDYFRGFEAWKPHGARKQQI
jgi:hypothetical protein